jgi:hypothetical protein
VRTPLRRLVADAGPNEFPDRAKIERSVIRLLA